MKKFKKLIPAFCLLLVSAVLMGTSTFAWFSMNKTVTATGMSVTAKADNPFLQISKDNTDFATTVAMGKTGTDLLLVTPLNMGTALVNYYADSAAAGTATTTTPTKATKASEVLWGTASSSDPTDAEVSNVPVKITAGDESKYYVSQELYLKVVANSADGKNLTAACALNGTTENSIAASVRVLIVTETGNYVIFDKDGTVKGGNAVLFETLTAGAEAQKVTVYMYFDGTDENAKTENATNLEAVAINLTFTID